MTAKLHILLVLLPSIIVPLINAHPNYNLRILYNVRIINALLTLIIVLQAAIASVSDTKEEWVSMKDDYIVVSNGKQTTRNAIVRVDLMIQWWISSYITPSIRWNH